MFGVLGVAEGGPGCQNQSNLAFHGSPFGSISAPFVDENRIIFHVCLLIVFMDAFFIDF